MNINITDISYIKFIILNISCKHANGFSLFSLGVMASHINLAVVAAPRSYDCWELMLLVLQQNDLYCCCHRIYPKMSLQEKSGFKG